MGSQVAANGLLTFCDFYGVWNFVPDIPFQLVSGPHLSPFKVAKDWARVRRPEFPARDKEVLEKILLK